MDLNSIIYGDNAQNIQLVVNAKDLRDFVNNIIEFAKMEIKERNEPRYYTRAELRDEILHVSDPTLINYRKRGLIPEPIKIGGKVLYDKAEVMKALTDKNNIKHFKINSWIPR